MLRPGTETLQFLYLYLKTELSIIFIFSGLTHWNTLKKLKTFCYISCSNLGQSLKRFQNIFIVTQKGKSLKKFYIPTIKQVSKTFFVHSKPKVFIFIFYGPTWGSHQKSGNFFIVTQKQKSLNFFWYFQFIFHRLIWDSKFRKFQKIQKIQKIFYSHTKTEIFKKAFIHSPRKDLL